VITIIIGLRIYVTRPLARQNA